VTPFVVATVSLLAMEPAVALAHRRAMHGWAWGWHRSHHQRAGGSFETNDRFPVVFAAATVAAMAVGATVEALAPLLWVGSGVTAYGIAYLVVHDLYIHRRLGVLPGAGAALIRRLAEAHRIHHLYGREPYGFLLPVVPAGLRARAQERPVDHRDALAGPRA
jgi:beta-carotene 3-hydroxylase